MRKSIGSLEHPENHYQASSYPKIGQISPTNGQNRIMMPDLESPSTVVYVDISKTFKKKWDAAHKFESQRLLGRYPQVPAMTIRAFLHGFQSKKLLSERFIKLEVPK